MFRPWVHPAGFVLVCLLKDGVGDYQAVFHTKVQEHSTIGVFLAEPVSAENLVPELVVLPHPGVEVPEYQNFLLVRYCLDGTVELLVEALLVLLWRCKGWSVAAEQRGCVSTS